MTMKITPVFSSAKDLDEINKGLDKSIRRDKRKKAKALKTPKKAFRHYE